jgi:hypothetical protein
METIVEIGGHKSGLILDCERFSDNHSDDFRKIYVGTANPLVMCGYHSSPLGNNIIQKVINEINKEKK